VIYWDIIKVNRDNSIDTNRNKSRGRDKVVGRIRERERKKEVVTQLPHS
jgi:hypothetical protein